MEMYNPDNYIIVLFVGGPVHGRFNILPKGVKEWKFNIFPEFAEWWLAKGEGERPEHQVALYKILWIGEEKTPGCIFAFDSIS